MPWSAKAILRELLSIRYARCLSAPDFQNMYRFDREFTRNTREAFRREDDKWFGERLCDDTGNTRVYLEGAGTRHRRPVGEQGGIVNEMKGLL
jgi:hypothetical protein